MSDPKSLVGYCGLYCGTCGIYNGEIRESVEQVRDIIKKYELDEIMPALAKFEPALKDYKKFEGVLDGLVRLLGSCSGCLRGGVSFGCTIRECVKRKGYATCAECNYAFTCEKLKPLRGYVNESLQRIRKVGLERWAEEMACDRRKTPKTEVCVIIGARALPMEMEEKQVKEYVKKRYGEIAKSETSYCSSCSRGPSAADIALRIGYSQEDLKIVPEASTMGLGCGNPVALASLKEGEIVLDLGSGGGIDVFLAAMKVGPGGKAIGVDMTEAMINRAMTTATKYGYKNVEFRLGEIENLPLEDETADVVISNCVINLSPDKQKVFQEAYRVLKPGGRILISDLVTEGKLPEEIRRSFDAWAGCIAGALQKSEYLDTIRRAGFKNVKIVSESTYSIDVSHELEGKIKSIQVEAYKN